MIELEQLFLNYLIRDDYNNKSIENTVKDNIITFGTINKHLNQLIDHINNKTNTKVLSFYDLILFNTKTFVPIRLDKLDNSYALTKDVFKKSQKKSSLTEQNSSIYVHAPFVNIKGLADKTPNDANLLDNDFKNPKDSSLVELFNVTLTKYMNELYDAPIKKYYNKLLNNFYSNYIIQNTNGGIYSMITPTSENTIKEFLQPILPFFTTIDRRNIETSNFSNILDRFVNSVRGDQAIEENKSAVLNFLITFLHTSKLIKDEDKNTLDNTGLTNDDKIKTINNILDLTRGDNKIIWVGRVNNKNPYLDIKNNAKILEKWNLFVQYMSMVSLDANFNIKSINLNNLVAQNTYNISNWVDCYNFVNFNEVVSDINIKTIFTVYNKNIQSNVIDAKFFLTPDKNNVSLYMQNKYKTLLPRFKELFEEINNRSLFLQNIINNINEPDINPTFKLNDLKKATINDKVLMNDDYVDNVFNGELLTTNKLNSCYRETLIKLNECCTYILMDIKTVMDEFSDESLPMYLELKPNFIQSYKQYNNNNLPFMPLSFASDFAINNYESVLNNKIDEKYFYGLRSIIDVNYQNVQSMANMPYVESLLNLYSSINDDYHKLDTNKVFGTIKNTMTLIQGLYKSQSIISYYTNSNEKMSTFCSADKTKTQIMNYVENSLDSKSKQSFCESIYKCLIKDTKYRSKRLNINERPGHDSDESRRSSILINIVDLNLNPINIHALLKEIPLINIINYAFTYDDIVNSKLLINCNDEVRKYLENGNNLNKITTDKLLLLDDIKVNNSTSNNNEFYTQLNSYISNKSGFEKDTKNAIIPLGKLPKIDYENKKINNEPNLDFNVDVLNTPLINNLLFCTNAQMLASLFLNDSKDVKVDKILNGIEILTDNFNF